MERTRSHVNATMDEAKTRFNNVMDETIADMRRQRSQLADNSDEQRRVLEELRRRHEEAERELEEIGADNEDPGTPMLAFNIADQG